MSVGTAAAAGGGQRATGGGGQASRPICNICQCPSARRVPVAEWRPVGHHRCHCRQAPRPRHVRRHPPPAHVLTATAPVVARWAVASGARLAATRILRARNFAGGRGGFCSLGAIGVRGAKDGDNHRYKPRVGGFGDRGGERPVTRPRGGRSHRRLDCHSQGSAQQTDWATTLEADRQSSVRHRPAAVPGDLASVGSAEVVGTAGHP